VNYVIDGLGRPSFDRLSDATIDPASGKPAIASNSLANIANRDRPVLRSPEVRTIIGACTALQFQVTPWALYHAAGVSMEPLGLTGRPTDVEVSALPMLPAGWPRMEAADFSWWVSGGRSVIAARAAQDQTDELATLREENEQLRAEVERLSTRRPRKTT
jgi:hypothetical protein